MRSLLIVFLVLASAPAAAEWVKNEEFDRYTSYLDPSTIRREGDTRWIWELLDFKERNSFSGVTSLRYFVEIDCKEGRVRTLQGSEHSEPMGEGRVIRTFTPPGYWTYATPGSMVAKYVGLICSYSVP